MQNTEERFIEIEMAISNLERIVDDLNDVIIKQGKDIAFLQKQNHYLTEAIRNATNTVKPQEQETPPPQRVEKYVENQKDLARVDLTIEAASAIYEFIEIDMTHKLKRLLITLHFFSSYLFFIMKGQCW